MIGFLRKSAATMLHNLQTAAGGDAIARQRSPVLRHVRLGRINALRTLDHGDAQSIGDVLVCGDESAMEQRLRRFAEAGVTDLNCRIVPLGEGRDAIKASAERTREFLASVVPALHKAS